MPLSRDYANALQCQSLGSTQKCHGEAVLDGRFAEYRADFERDYYQ